MFHRAYHATINRFDPATGKMVSMLETFKKYNTKPNNAIKLMLYWILSITTKTNYDYFVAC